MARNFHENRVEEAPMPMIAKKQRRPARAQLGKIVSAAAEATTIAEIMTRTAICVKPDFGVEALTALLLGRGISGAPVIDDTGRPIGMVSKSDVVRERFIERGATV